MDKEKREKEREGLISVKRKGKSVALLLVHLEFLGRRERRRTGDVYMRAACNDPVAPSREKFT